MSNSVIFNLDPGPWRRALGTAMRNGHERVEEEIYGNTFGIELTKAGDNQVVIFSYCAAGPNYAIAIIDVDWDTGNITTCPIKHNYVYFPEGEIKRAKIDARDVQGLIDEVERLDKFILRRLENTAAEGCYI
ncbi:MAG: hypothetical protein LBF42_04235 [Puniceicoccales bacterium]|jgi:hypothetical protein|nr:hypothetical protein [Puniceicoccales bacterium]